MKSLDLDRELRMQLSWITSGELMKVFLSPMHHKGMINIPTPIGIDFQAEWRDFCRCG